MRNFVAYIVLPTAATLGFSPAHAALPDFTVTVEAPGVVNSNAGFDYFGIETFDSRDYGIDTFWTNFNSSPIAGEYSGVNIMPADQFGGAGNTGRYAVAGLENDIRSYSIKFSQPAEDGDSYQGINYFGYWLSALDAGNTVEFFNGGTSLGTFDPGDVLSFVGGQDAYFGNPFTGPDRQSRQNKNEPYVFVNFFLEAGTFDTIVFRQAAGSAGYESDNHTVGWYKETSGTVIPSVPEPSTWAMMLLGFGCVGGLMRGRNKTAKAGSPVHA